MAVRDPPAQGAVGLRGLAGIQCLDQVKGEGSTTCSGSMLWTNMLVP